MDEMDEEVMARVLANEPTARMFVQALQARGCVFHRGPKKLHRPDELSHEECIDLVLEVMTELDRRERREPQPEAPQEA